MKHAFTWLPWPHRWVVLALLLAGTVALMIKLSRQGKPLRTTAAPNGILSYEFAGGQQRAAHILSSWDAIKETARDQLLLDFPFLVLYPLLLSLACVMLAESSTNRMAVAGIFCSWAVLAAGPLDTVENVALLRMLDAGASQSLARLAGWCAGVKFLLIATSLGYVVVQGAKVLVRWWTA